MALTDATHYPGDADERERHHDGCTQSRIDVDTGAMRSLKHKMGKARDVVGDGRHRQPLDRLLQPQLDAPALVHRVKQVPVLILDLDLHPRAQEVGGPRQFAR
jgi:hypothetical protein